MLFFKKPLKSSPKNKMLSNVSKNTILNQYTKVKKDKMSSSKKPANPQNEDLKTSQSGNFCHSAKTETKLAEEYGGGR
jgi:hypothetical protein